MSFHSGEIAIQNQAGVRQEAQSLCHMISNVIKQPAQVFLKNQQFAVASTVDTMGNVWASLLVGKSGFIKILNPQQITINLDLISIDLLKVNIASNHHIGLLVIDLANRRRLRLNGKADLQSENTINVEIEQAFFNCPKYIQSRYVETAITESFQQSDFLIKDTLSQTDENWINQADTFFIASFHPESGADASHRGGFPGFVKVLNNNKLLFPDYAGNNMFQTFGNLLVNPNAGLLFIDFAAGNTLQISGKSKIIWDTERLSEFAGAQRLVEFDIEEVLESRNATLLRWRFGEYSPANPG